MNGKRNALYGAMVLAVGLSLTGCGGGGGSDTAAPPASILSGTAAGGAAVVGSVTLKDSKGATRGATIDVNGNYSIDVSGLTAPFVLRAEGRVGNTSVIYHSAATSADVNGNVNITPLTDLMVANIAGQMASAYYNNFQNQAGLVDRAALDAAENALQAKLQPILDGLGMAAGIDLLRASFKADHTGLDACLDLVRVTMDPAANKAILTNALNQIQLGEDSITTRADDAAPLQNAAEAQNLANAGAGAATDMQTIGAALNVFADLFRNGLPTQAQLANSGFFDTVNLLNSGQNFDQWTGQMMTDPSNIGMQLSVVSMRYEDAAKTRAWVTIRAKDANGRPDFYPEGRFEKQNGIWKFVGDGRIAELDVQANAEDGAALNGTDHRRVSGLSMQFDANPYNATHGGVIDHAIVTGPGLAAGGVRLIAMQPFSYWFIPECGLPGVFGDCVNIVATVDNGQYTFVFYDINHQALNGSGDTVTLAKVPLATADLTPAMFPGLVSATINGTALTGLAQLQPNANVNLAWTIPSGQYSEGADVWAWGNNAQLFNIWQDVLPSATSATLALGNFAGVPGNAGIRINTQDVFGREFVTSREAGVGAVAVVAP